MKLLLVFLVVFCGQLFAVSDVEMLPRVMGELKKDLDSSKTWGEFLTKSQVMGFAEMMVFDQLVGLSKPIPKYQFSNNLRKLTVGDQTLEVVNLSTSDFLLNGKPFRAQKDESYFESFQRMNSKKYTTSFLSLFVSKAHAQQTNPGICNPTLLNQLKVFGGVAKMAGNQAAHLAHAAMVEANNQTTFQPKEVIAQNCADIVNNMKTAQNNAGNRLIGFSCKNSIVSFKVPDYFAKKENCINPYGTANPMDEQGSKDAKERMKCAVPTTGDLVLHANFSKREFTDARMEKSYFYSNKGIDKTAELAKNAAGEIRLDCKDGFRHDAVEGGTQEAFQMLGAASVLNIVSDSKICEKEICADEIADMVRENRAMPVSNSRGSVVPVEAISPKCIQARAQFLNGCMSEKNFANTSCARPSGIPARKCVPGPVDAGGGSGRR